MGRIRYLAILSERPAELSEFYKHYLLLEEIGKSEQGDVSLTDGFYNLTLFKWRPSLLETSMEPGLHHVGVQVDSIEEVKAHYLRFNPRGIIVEEPGDIHHGEARIYDPECHPISLSEKGFGIGEGNRIPRVRHIAYNALDPDTMVLFYSQVLGLRELPTSYQRRQQGRGNRFAGDGYTNLAIHPFYSTQEGHERRFGINHMGFLVHDLKTNIEKLSAIVGVQSRPANRPYAEFRFRDPDGNPVDLSQSKGWEVDVNKWERAA